MEGSSSNYSGHEAVKLRDYEMTVQIKSAMYVGMPVIVLSPAGMLVSGVPLARTIQRHGAEYGF
jgi:hypothetical protein